MFLFIFIFITGFSIACFGKFMLCEYCTHNNYGKGNARTTSKSPQQKELTRLGKRSYYYHNYNAKKYDD